MEAGMTAPDLSALPSPMLFMLEHVREVMLKSRREEDWRTAEWADGYISGALTTLVWAKRVSKDDRRELREWFLREEESNGEDV